MKKIKEFFVKHKFLCLSLLLTLILIGIIFGIKGIYPFGNESFKMNDFDYTYVPIYYKLWDLLHGNGSVLFDWNLGSGLYCFGSLIANSLWMPTSLIIGLFSRSFIPYAMSFIIIVKLLTVSLCTYIAVNELFPKVKGMYKVISTLLYTFSGWTIFMLSSLAYLDVLALFPLLVLAYYRLMKNNKWEMYVIVLTICLLLSYYMSWMILLFIIGITIISLLTLDIKNKKKKALLIILLTLLAIGMSSVLVLPAIYQEYSSYKFINIVEIPYLGETLLKIVYILPMVVPIFFTIKQFFVKKDKKINLFFGLLLIYLLLGIFIPQINGLWHWGEYNGLPFRYSFIPSFILILCSLYYLDNNFKENKKSNKINVIVAGCLIIALLGLAYLYRNEYLNQIFLYVISTYSQFFCLLFLFILSIVALVIIVKTNKKVLSILLLLISCVQIIIYGYYFVDNSKLEQVTSVNTQKIYDSFNLVNDGYNYMDNTSSLNVNFPYILNVPSIENRLHIIKEHEINFSNRMGYYAFDTFIYARGGTLFSNLLMQNKYYFSYVPLNERLYSLIDKKDEYYLYESKYNLKYIIPYSGKIVNDYSNVLIDNVNLLYKELFNKEGNIMHLIEDTEVTLSKDNVYYFYSYSGFTYDIYNSILEKDEDYYRNSYMSYDRYISEIIINGEDITLDLSEYDDLRIAYINIEEFIEFVDGIDDYEVTSKIVDGSRVYNYKTEEDTSVLIPINYDEGLVIKVNGKEVNYVLNAYNMISINIEKGGNEIVISYVPKYLKEGIIVSIVSMLLLAIVYLTNKKFHYLDTNK